MFDASQLESALTEREVLLRDAFVCEYLKDFNAYRACLRMGFQAAYAVHWEKQFMDDGYVQRKITHMTTRLADSPEQIAMDRALVENTLRQVMLRGSDSARVAAVARFNEMRGWSKAPDGGEVDEDLVESFKRIAAQLPA